MTDGGFCTLSSIPLHYCYLKTSGSGEPIQGSAEVKVVFHRFLRLAFKKNQTSNSGMVVLYTNEILSSDWCILFQYVISTEITIRIGHYHHVSEFTT